MEENGEEIVSDKKSQKDGNAVFALEIPDAKLWSVDTPELYTCKLKYEDDVQEHKFGIRTLTCDHTDGLKINGERVIIRGRAFTATTAYWVREAIPKPKKERLKY